MDCMAKCELVLTCQIEGQTVELRMVPFHVSEKKGFQARDCVATQWERCMEDVIWMQRQGQSASPNQLDTALVATE